VIVAHHGFGEELVLYAVAGGGAAVPALVVVWRVRLARLARWLRRR
jgi:hypothetical protein